MVDQYCDQLAVSLGELHEECRDAEVENRRQSAMKEADKGPGMRFNVGDYVVVSATKNQANRQSHNKNMVKWQGPYEVTGTADGTSKFSVLLVGTADVKDVH